MPWPTPARLAIALSFSSSEFAMTAGAASMIRARFSVASARRGGAVIFPLHDGLANGHVSANLGVGKRTRVHITSKGFTMSSINGRSSPSRARAAASARPLHVCSARVARLSSLAHAAPSVSTRSPGTSANAVAAPSPALPTSPGQRTSTDSSDWPSRSSAGSTCW